MFRYNIFRLDSYRLVFSGSRSPPSHLQILFCENNLALAHFHISYVLHSDWMASINSESQLRRHPQQQIVLIKYASLLRGCFRVDPKQKQKMKNKLPKTKRREKQRNRKTKQQQNIFIFWRWRRSVLSVVDFGHNKLFMDVNDFLRASQRCDGTFVIKYICLHGLNNGATGYVEILLCWKEESTQTGALLKWSPFSHLRQPDFR